MLPRMSTSTQEVKVNDVALRLWSFLHGREGEGEAEPASSPPPQEPPQAGGSEQTFSKEYVEGLRQEAAKWRTELRSVQEKLSEHEKAQMSELEKAQIVAREAQTRADELVADLHRERFDRAVVSAATRARLADPEDAIRLIDPDSVKTDDDGNPDRQSLEAAITRLTKDKPYLLSTATTTGSGDGGSRGAGGNPAEDERLKRIAAQIESRGGVLRPV